MKRSLGYYTEEDEDLIRDGQLPPGEEIKSLLISFYPNNSKTFVDQLDSDLRADGQLKDLFYESLILYTLRRLVTSAEYIHRLNGGNFLKTRAKLKDHLEDTTRLSNLQINSLIKPLIGCIETARDEFGDGDKNFVKKQMKLNNWKCFVCGKDMNASNCATADHLWPRAMGGLSKKFNLRMVCQPCNNNYKADYINYSDYHFEEIAFPVTDYEHYLRSSQPNWFETAIFAKSNYECAVCEQPAYRVGELYIGRINQNEGWHYLNLTAYCFGHKPE